MHLDCDNLKSLVDDFSLVYDCQVLKDETLRIATPFQYPDGSLIDVFFKSKVSPPEAKDSLAWGYLLSDFGQTMLYLADLHIKPWANSQKRRLLRDICESLGIEYHNGELQVWLDSKDVKTAADGIVRLAQACIRVADLYFLQKHSTVNTFSDEVKKFLGSEGVEGSPVELPGRWGRSVEIDYVVHGKKQESLIKTVSTGGTASSIHPYLTEAFSRWYDLAIPREQGQRITVIDDRDRVSRGDDLDRLKQVSEIILFPREKQKFNDLLKAG